MKRKFFPKITVLTLFIILFAGINLTYADDGYDLWLKYNKVSDAQKLAQYQAAISSCYCAGRFSNL